MAKFGYIYIYILMDDGQLVLVVGGLGDSWIPTSDFFFK
jgi:hypothetical protein